METGGRPDCGVYAAVDVHYLRAGGARAAALLAADAAFAHVLAERTAVVPQVSPYRPGEFYLRELPPLRAVLEDLSGLGLLVVGFVMQIRGFCVRWGLGRDMTRVMPCR